MCELVVNLCSSHYPDEGLHVSPYNQAGRAERALQRFVELRRRARMHAQNPLLPTRIRTALEEALTAEVPVHHAQGSGGDDLVDNAQAIRDWPGIDEG